MKTGRPKILNKPVTITVLMEERSLNDIDSLRGRHSRGRYISILSIADDLKTKKILDLKDDVYKLERKVKELSVKKEENITEAFRKAIYSHFRNYANDFIENKMSSSAKKLWCEKLQCNPNKLKEYIW